MKKHNFNAGPSILPREVIEQTAQAILDFNGSGLSILEISHRHKDFQAVIDEATALFKEILNIPEGYFPSTCSAARSAFSSILSILWFLLHMQCFFAEYFVVSPPLGGPFCSSLSQNSIAFLKLKKANIEIEEGLFCV